MRAILSWLYWLRRWGKRIFLVVEKMNELRLIAKMAKQLNVRPNIGIRIKLAFFGQWKMGKIAVEMPASLD